MEVGFRESNKHFSHLIFTYVLILVFVEVGFRAAVATPQEVEFKRVLILVFVEVGDPDKDSEKCLSRLRASVGISDR